MKLSWHSVFDRVLQKSSVRTEFTFLFEIALENETNYVDVPFIMLYTIVD